MGCSPTPRQLFIEKVVPELEAGCSSTACHGVGPEDEARGDVINWGRLFFAVDINGHLVDPDAAYEAALRIIDPSAPDFSSFLRKPLSVSYEGSPHTGGASFSTPDDTGYKAFREWVAAEPTGGESASPLSRLEQVFADQAEPALLSMGCATTACHGPDAAIPFRLNPGVQGLRSTSMSRQNYRSALVMASLDGDPRQSRLLKKSLPLHRGGIVHKGGNDGFLVSVDDPRALAITDWICQERQERLGQPCLTPEVPAVKGIVFVQGPLAPENPFDLDRFEPGSDLFLAWTENLNLNLSQPENLTESFHEGPADIADPAIHPDGTHILFSMRRSNDDGHHIYELDFATRELTQLTFESSTEVVSTDRDPTYGPEQSVWFVSTRQGVLADRSSLPDADLYELDRETGETTRRTATPHIERKPVFLEKGAVAGEVTFTALRDVTEESRRAHGFRFPPGLSTEYHQHFGASAPENLLWDTRELADARYVCVVGDLDNAWPAGRLGIVDRNFGPEIPPARLQEGTSLPFYAPPFSRLDDESRASGLTQRAYRDPVGLPDGRILSSVSVDPLDLNDEAAAPRFRLEVISLKVDPVSLNTQIADRKVLLEHETLSISDVEPLFVRPTELQEDKMKWNRDASTGVFRHLGVSLIDALLQNLPPVGVKVAVDSPVAVRLVQMLPQKLGSRTKIPANETRYDVDNASSLSLGSHLPSQVLAELPLAADGTFQAEIAADLPFRLQLLDEKGMHIGETHNRWYSLSPGQVISQGASSTSPNVYGVRCAACHGGLDGDTESVFAPPDVITSASWTLSRYESQNPRRPIEPPLLGADTVVEVDFRAHVLPILVARCMSCHDGASAPGGLSLRDDLTTHYVDAYENLLAPGAGSRSGMRYVDEPGARASGSFLVEKLLGTELDAPRSLQNPGGRHPSATSDSALRDEELRTILRWIDLGATFVGTGNTP
ncbi:MAG: hypothetical protein GY822_07870 [Deltaproteobacteria bacterium]|nr:hypothetical protein [Deltaproteobacteria bacterium]